MLSPIGRTLKNRAPARDTMGPFTPLQFSLFDIFPAVEGFLLVYILIGAAIGAISRKLSITAFGAWVVYTHIVIETDIFIYDAILYLVGIILILWVSRFIVAGYLETESDGVDG